MAAAAALYLAAATAGACDVPVCVMALREWRREPYRVGYFYRGEASPAGTERRSSSCGVRRHVRKSETAPA